MTESGAFAAMSDGGQHLSRRTAVRVGAGVGLGATALSLLPFLSGRAGAAPPTSQPANPDPTTSEPTSTEPASTVATTATGETTTSAPPQRPTSDDVALLGFAQQVETSAVALYNEALKVIGSTDEQVAVITFIRDAHLAYAQSLSGLLGRVAPNTSSQAVFNAQKAGFNGTSAAVLAAAAAFESAAVATHGDVISKLVGTDGASLIASIQMNEARYSTVLADLAGITDPTMLLVDQEAAPLKAGA